MNPKTIKIIKIAVQVVFYSLIAYFFYKYFRTIKWSDLTSLKFNVLPLIVGIFLMISTRFLMPPVWIFMLKKFQQNTKDYISLYYAYAKSWLGKYIPGGVASLSAKIYFASEIGFDKKVLAIVSLLEMIVQVLGGMISGILFIGLSGSKFMNYNFSFFSIILSAGLLVFTLPPVFNRIAKIGYKILKKKDLDSKYELHFDTIILSVLMYVGLNIITGLCVYYICLTVVPGLNFAHNILYVTGVSSIAGALGMVALFAPSGIGVREGVNTILFASLFSKSQILLILLLIRVGGIAADLLFFLISSVGILLKKKNDNANYSPKV